MLSICWSSKENHTVACPKGHASFFSEQLVAVKNIHGVQNPFYFDDL